MPDGRDVQRLLSEAAHAPTLQESQRLVYEAERLRTSLQAQASAGRDLDLAGAQVRELLTPVAVHEHHTAATDWIGEITTAPDAGAMQNTILAQATLWHGKLPAEVRADDGEFAEQARGKARRLAGVYGEHAQVAYQTFIDHVAGLHRREAALRPAQAATGAPQVGEGGYPSDVFPTGSVYEGLPGDATTSERASNIAQVESPDPSQDLTSVNDPGLGQADTQVDRQNGDAGTTQVADMGQDKQASMRRQAHTGVDNPQEIRRMLRDMSPAEVAANRNALAQEHGEDHPLVQLLDDHMNIRDNLGRSFASRKDTPMPHAQCPTCGGHGRVAVRATPQRRPLTISQIVAGQHTAFSGLPQVDQVINPSDTAVQQTPLPEQVAWPWEMDANSPQDAIPEAEQQIKQREQMKGASRRKPTRQQAAQMAARLAYQQIMAGQDDSGWMGDMGATPPGPGEQDGGNAAGQTNLQTPDDVYGYGGDNGNQPLRPFGQDEADDEHNNPSTWAPGQPAQMDMAARPQMTAVPGGGGPAFPNPPVNNGKKSSRRTTAVDNDPQLAKALAFVRQRRAFLESQAS